MGCVKCWIWSSWIRRWLSWSGGLVVYVIWTMGSLVLRDGLRMKLFGFVCVNFLLMVVKRMSFWSGGLCAFVNEIIL